MDCALSRRLDSIDEEECRHVDTMYNKNHSGTGCFSSETFKKRNFLNNKGYFTHLLCRQSQGGRTSFRFNTGGNKDHEG